MTCQRSSVGSTSTGNIAFGDHLLSTRPHLAIGLGTLDIPKDDVKNAILSAIRSGYRRIDCAPVYFNEDAIGDALRDILTGGEGDLDIRREDLYIVSKLASPFHRYGHVRVGLQKTLTDLRLDYLDMFLVHWPQAFHYVDIDPTVRGYINEDIDDSANGRNIDTTVSIHETWSGMEELVDEGLVKSIGVSNFPVSLLHELMTTARIRPAVNQVEAHPYLQQTKLLAYCEKRGVHFQAYSPLGTPGYKADEEPSVLEDPVLKEIAANHSTTVAQICITWAIQRGTSVVVKSSNPKRIQENFDVLHSTTQDSESENHTCINPRPRPDGISVAATKIHLSDGEMELIAQLERGHRFFRPEDWWGELGMAVFD